MKSSNQTLMLKSLVVACSLVASVASAKTDVSGKIAQLKENTEASKQNLEQYETNLKTVNTNLTETERALKQLQKQKEALAKQTADANKSKNGVDAAKTQLIGYMKTEQLKLDHEKKQIDELKKALAQLEENAQKREANIAQYQEKIQKVDGELGSWSERNQSIVELEQAIKQKEDAAKADHKRLAEKKATYEAESVKWKKQVRVSQRTYENFSGLKD